MNICPSGLSGSEIVCFLQHCTQRKDSVFCCELACAIQLGGHILNTLSPQSMPDNIGNRKSVYEDMGSGICAVYGLQKLVIFHVQLKVVQPTRMHSDVDYRSTRTYLHHSCGGIFTHILRIQSTRFPDDIFINFPYFSVTILIKSNIIYPVHSAS